MVFELPIGTLIICLSLTCGWFSGNPIYYIWCTPGVYMVGLWIRDILKSKKQKG